MTLTLVVMAALAAAESPAQVVKNADSAAQEVMKSKDASVAKLAAKADEFIDFGELAKRALGEEWAKLKKPQQEDFSSTMKGLLRASYAQKAIGDGRGDAKIEYGKEEIAGAEATVPSTIEVKKDKFSIVYKLFKADAKSGWKIFDVITDEVSLVQTYNDQFRTTIAKKGFDGLLIALKARRDQLEKAPAPTAVPTVK